MRRLAVGADVGGSHITCQLYDLESHTLVQGTRHTVPVDCNAAKESILDLWTGAIRACANGHHLEALAGIGFAMPGPFDYPNGIAWFKGVEKFDNLYGVNIREELLARLGLPATFTIRFMNDATCFAIGESFHGEAAKCRKFLAITLGTGFGTTFIDSHLPIAGERGLPEDGFLYHIPFNSSNADNHFSTRWFVREYKATTGQEVHGVKELAALIPVDPVATTLFQTFGHNLGLFLAPWLKRFNAECLVIGGNIASGYRFFIETLEKELEREGVQTKVVRSLLQEGAALSGSANLCDDRFYCTLIPCNKT
jgi:glucokinase